MKGIKLLLGDMVLIKPDEVETITKGGILIPDTAKVRPKIGTVAFVGEGDEEPMTVKKGNRVIYESYAATDINVEGEDYFIIPEKNIMAIL